MPTLAISSQGEERRKPMSGSDKPMNRKEYEKALRALQVELCALQDWIKGQGLRVVVVFEGRDAAGKGVFRVVALPAPSDRDKSQLYMQRYIAHFPAAGEIVLFDRSWYNRAGVEYVMGFCSKAQHQRFLLICPEFERYVVDDGILLVKYWLEVSDTEQKRRFAARITDPLRQWKLSPRTCARGANGSSTRAHATSCSRPRTRNLRLGTSCPRMTSGARVSTASVTCSA
jgi:polyphosphate kinase 2 (PPK2 family)